MRPEGEEAAKEKEAGDRVVVEIQFGAGDATSAAELEAEGTRDPEWAISPAKHFLKAGAYLVMIESEGITENVKSGEPRSPPRSSMLWAWKKTCLKRSIPRSLADVARITPPR